MLDALIKTPRLYAAKISPDLKWVVWTWANVGPFADVYIAPLAEVVSDFGNNLNVLNLSDVNFNAPDFNAPDFNASDLNSKTLPRKLAGFGQSSQVVSWTEDSRYVVVSHDYDGDERLRLYKVDITNGEIQPLTEEKPPYFINGGQIDVSGRYLVYAVNYDFSTGALLETNIVYRQDLKTGEKIKLAQCKKPAYVHPVINKQGTHVMYRSADLDPSGFQVRVVDIDGKSDREILNFGEKVKIESRWHPNGEEIVFVVEAVIYKRVGVYRLADSSIRYIVDDPKRDIEEAYIPQGSNDMILVETINARNIVSVLNFETGQENKLENIKTIIPIGKTPNGFWVSKMYRSNHPEDLIVHDEQKIIYSITDVFKVLSFMPEILVQAENYFWSSVDGMQIQGWLYRPKIKNRGTIVFVHGGPTAHSEDAWNIDIQYFVSEGFTVLDPNYRGSTGFGLSYRESIKEHGWGGREQDDILEGIKALIRDGIAEEGRVGITGTSYGGYCSWFAITHFSTKYVAAAVPICGMTDLVVDYESTRPDLKNYSEEMLGGTPTEVPSKYYEASPIHFISNIKGELLIVQGLRDPNVTIENLHVVEEALKKAEIRYETLVFENEGHGIYKPENQKELLSRCAEFFVRVLR